MRKHRFSCAITLRNQNGVGLVEVMAAAAIMMIIIFAIVSSQVSISRENRALSEKLAALDFERSVTEYLSNSTNCSAMLTTAGNIASGSLTIPSGIGPSAPLNISLNQLPTAVAGSALATAGGKVSSLSSTLALQGSGVTPLPGIQVSITSPPAATLSINFNQGNLAQAIHNLQFPITLQVSGPTIIGCGITSGSASGSTVMYLYGADSVMPSVTSCSDGPPAPCPSGWTDAGVGQTSGDGSVPCGGNNGTLEIRTCVITGVHSVMYLHGAKSVMGLTCADGPPAACPAGWTEAGLGQTSGDGSISCGGNNGTMEIRTCFQ